MLALAASLLVLTTMSSLVGAQNTGASFDATVDGYIEVPFAPQLVPQSGITVEAWITYDESTVPTGWRYPTIVRQGINASSENIMLRMNGDQNAQLNRVLRWRVRTSSGSTLTTDYAFAAGEFLTWTHVAGTYDGATLALYVNGTLVSSVPGNGLPLNVGTDVFRIGKGSDIATPIEVFNGEIDEVRLWPFARTAEDIQQAMHLELSSVPGYVSTWNLNSDFTDSSGGQHATSGGSVTFAGNPLTLTQSQVLCGFSQGASTPGCNGEMLLATSGPSVESYGDFRIVCTRTEPNTVVFWGGSVGAAASPIAVLGVDVWLDLNGLVIAGLQADAFGSAGLSLPIPAGIAGYTFGIQAIALDSCGSQGFAASDALVVAVQ